MKPLPVYAAEDMVNVEDAAMEASNTHAGQKQAN